VSEKAALMSSSDRQTFTREVVRAIKELELRRSSKSQQELADTAWDKLQYDLPVLETAELQALLQQLRYIPLMYAAMAMLLCNTLQIAWLIMHICQCVCMFLLCALVPAGHPCMARMAGPAI
jgi:hypothetical protein